MLSQNNEYLKEASETVYHLTQEEKVRLQCQAREDYYRRMKGIQEKFEHYKAEKIQSDAEIAALEKGTGSKKQWVTLLFAFASKEKRPGNPTSSSQLIFAILLLQKLL